MTERAVRSIQMGDDEWLVHGENLDHLTAILVINGTFHHLEAIRVVEDEDGIQVAASPDLTGSLDALYQLGGDGPFDTVIIHGATYVVSVIPFQ